VKTKFEVPKNIRLPKDTKASIVSQSLIGGKTIELSWGNSLEYLEDNDTISTSTVKDITKMFTGYSDDILAKIVPIEEKLDIWLKKITITTDQLQESILSVNKILNKNEQKINMIIGNIDQLIQLVNQSTVPLLNESLTEIRDFGKQLNSTKTKEILSALNTTTQSLAELTKNMSSSKNTINSLFTSNELHQKIIDLLADFKTNPERYVKISVFSKETPEVKYKNKIEGIEMKKKWQEYQSEQKK
jgi:phospholipid/cholesterol/gamma-HCH transport system substrate-binding protein